MNNPTDVQSDTTIALSRAEALVLFEYLARTDPSESLIKHPAEGIVLNRIEGQLEKSLAEIFQVDYHQQLARAREEVAR